MMEKNDRVEQNKCIAHQSLQNILSSSNRKFDLRRNQSLPSCLKFTSRPIKQVKRSNPTIGELLGDDDQFHHRYHHHYNPLKSKRKRYSHHGRRKDRHSTHFNSSNHMSLSPDIHPYYPYATVYNYPNYSYYYWPNITPCLICDSYRGFYATEAMPSFSY